MIVLILSLGVFCLYVILGFFCFLKKGELNVSLLFHLLWWEFRRCVCCGGFFWGGFKHWSLFYHMGLVGVCCFNSVAAVLEACNMSSGED